METTAVVLHEGALAHYDVAINEDGSCQAYLQAYNGRQENKPPQKLILHKERRHWVADGNYKALADELGYAIEIKAKPLLHRNRSGGHPAA